MKIIRDKESDHAMELVDFAEEHGLTLRVRKMDLSGLLRGRVTAWFEGVRVKTDYLENHWVIDRGIGDSASEAIVDYARHLSRWRVAVVLSRDSTNPADGRRLHPPLLKYTPPVDEHAS